MSTISSRLCFLLFWVSKVNQRNRAESWDYWEQLQLHFQSLPAYFKGKQQPLFTQCILLLSQPRAGHAVKERSEVLRGCWAKSKCRNKKGWLKSYSPSSAKARVLSGRAATCPSGCALLVGPTSLPGQAQSFQSAISSSDLARCVQILSGYHRLLSLQRNNSVQWGNELRRFVGVHIAAGSAHAIHVKSTKSVLFVLIWHSFRSSCYWGWILYWQDKYS